MKSLIILLDATTKCGTKYWTPIAIPDGRVQLQVERVRISGRRNQEIPIEQFLVYLNRPLPEAPCTSRLDFIPIPLFANYAPPPGNFPPWRLSGEVVDDSQDYVRLRNVHLYGVQDVPTRWCQATLGPNVFSYPNSSAQGIEKRL